MLLTIDWLGRMEVPHYEMDPYMELRKHKNDPSFRQVGVVVF